MVVVYHENGDEVFDCECGVGRRSGFLNFGWRLRWGSKGMLKDLDIGWALIFSCGGGVRCKVGCAPAALDRLSIGVMDHGLVIKLGDYVTGHFDLAITPFRIIINWYNNAVSQAI
jgi:hypothetical protein